MTSFKGKYDYLPRFLRKICHVSMKQEKIIFFASLNKLKRAKKFRKHEFIILKNVFCKLKKLKKHEFYFLQARNAQKAWTQFCASLKNLKKHELNFYKFKKEKKKHGLNFLQT